MKVTIRKHNQQFVTRLANQMGCSTSEAINYLLTIARRDNFSFSSEMGVTAFQSSASPLTQPIAYVDEIPDDFDPGLAHLIDAGLLDQF